MLSLLPLTKMFTLFSLLSFIVVTFLSYIVSLFGIDTYSDLRLLMTVGVILEFLLVYMFATGWRKVWAIAPILNKWIFPDLNGDWVATIDWNWRDGDEVKTGTKEGAVFIKQTLLKFSVDLRTDE